MEWPNIKQCIFENFAEIFEDPFQKAYRISLLPFLSSDRFTALAF
jgi:hypothetical protein